MRETKIATTDLLELIHFARRYCDGRMTGAPHKFNQIYWQLIHDNPWLQERDAVDGSIKYFPFAQDGMYKEGEPYFNAIPEEARKGEL